MVKIRVEFPYKKLMKLIYKKFPSLHTCCLIIFFFSLLVSPVVTVFFLFLPSTYYIYRGNYKDLCFIWVFHFVSWYLVFAACMFNFEGSIIIGKGFTGDLVFYTVDTYSDWSSPFNWLGYLLDHYCMGTILFLNFLSKNLGCTIYIPSIYKGIWSLIKYFF